MNKKEIAHNIKKLAYEMYQVGFRDGKEESITKEEAIDFLEAIGWQGVHDEEMIKYGMEIAWECAKKLSLMSSDSGFDNKTVKEIFGTTNCYSIFEKMSVSTVVAKIKDYEEQQKQTDAEISVGDEVMVNDIDRKAIVIGISTFEDWIAPYNILFENGNTDWVRKDIISKTGKRYSQIDEVLKELRGDEE